MRAAREEPPPELRRPERPHEEPPPAQRLRFRIGREGPARFLSHLEWATAWTRLLRRAQFDVAHSQGFHTHPKVSFSTALPVGEESEAEHMDVVLRRGMPPEEALERVRRELPEGFLAYEAAEASLRAPALMAQTVGFRYLVSANADPVAVEQAIADLLAAETLPVERKLKAKKRKPGGPQTREVDVRSSIAALELKTRDPLAVFLEIRSGDGQTAKPKEVAARIGLPAGSLRIRKTATLLEE
jgi:radical SAM-linked protein